MDTSLISGERDKQSGFELWIKQYMEGNNTMFKAARGRWKDQMDNAKVENKKAGNSPK